MNYQFVEYDADAPYLGGDIVDPMGQFYCSVMHSSPTFVEFLLNALNSVPPTAKETT